MAKDFIAARKLLISGVSGIRAAFEQNILVFLDGLP